MPGPCLPQPGNLMMVPPPVPPRCRAAARALRAARLGPRATGTERRWARRTRRSDDAGAHTAARRSAARRPRPELASGGPAAATGQAAAAATAGRAAAPQHWRPSRKGHGAGSRTPTALYARADRDRTAKRGTMLCWHFSLDLPY